MMHQEMLIAGLHGQDFRYEDKILTDSELLQMQEKKRRDEERKIDRYEGFYRPFIMLASVVTGYLGCGFAIADIAFELKNVHPSLGVLESNQPHWVLAGSILATFMLVKIQNELDKSYFDI